MTQHQPRKRFGQHFLKDAGVLQEIMRCLSLNKNDNVVEIGPGLGALTEYLLASLDHLNAVELDRDLISHLEKKFDAKKLTVFSADALDFDYASLSKTRLTPKDEMQGADERATGVDIRVNEDCERVRNEADRFSRKSGKNDLRIVGNLPYNISTPLLFKLFSEIDCIRDMHFMLQKEVVLRLTAEIGSADYGRLSVMSQYFCDNDYLFTVLPTSFDPPPRVDSAIVRLTPKKQSMLSEKQFSVFSAIVKEAFNYRRKKLGNCLKRFIDVNALKNINIDPNLRPQDTSVAEFIRISEVISVE